ncbi:MAG: S8 family serine peptidase [Patescibacteria group bacterium]|nr:S8 family serine peptidase [Patescibacteria group bacterium]
MKKLVMIVMIIVLVGAMETIFNNNSFGAFVAPKNTSIDTSATNYIPGEILVKYNSDFRENASRSLQRSGARTLKKFRTGVWLVKLPENVKVEKALKNYKKDSRIEYAEPNYYYRNDEIYGDEHNMTLALPNDPHFNKQWGLHNTGQLVNNTRGVVDADLDALEAWSILTKNGSNKEDIVVAVIGTGIAPNHPDLSNNIWINPDEIPDDNIDNDRNGYVDDIIGWDFFYNKKNPIDGSGHETHIGSILSAVRNNAIGMAGVCLKTKIMSLKTANSLGLSATSDLVAAIEYASRKNVAVINLSLGGSKYSQSFKDAIEASSAVVVCAAGNNGRDNSIDPHYPANYDLPNIISVAATDQKDTLAAFSNYSFNLVDVSAPGVDIYGARPSRKEIWLENFDDGNIAGWKTGGRHNMWATTDKASISGDYSLTDSLGRNYFNDTESWARTPVINLTNCETTKLEFFIGGEIERGYDFLYVQTSKNQKDWKDSLISIPGVGFMYSISGNTGKYWLPVVIDLEEYDGEKNIYIRFYLVTDGTETRDGYYLEDLKITASSDFYKGNEYMFKDGTSIAAPYVAGIVASIKKQKPSLTNVEIINIIENNVDKISSLRGIIATEGRVNLYNCLFPPLPTELVAEIISNNKINLSWEDNSPNEDEFRVERMKNGGKWEEIASLNKNVTSYRDRNLQEGDSCCYRVTAFNQNGYLDNCPEICTTLAQCGDGDVAPLGNRDGIVNVGDALVALRFALELEIPTQTDICHGDVAPLDASSQPNPDGQITVGDALVILRKALGLINP